MAFRFPMATVLRLREIAEEREERLVTQILQQQAQARQTLIDLADRRMGLMRKREDALARKTSAAELLMFQGQIRTVEGLQVSGEKHLGDLEMLRQKQMQVYQAAHRDRELLAGMRAQHLDLYRVEQLRQEQSLMDDNFTARRRLL